MSSLRWRPWALLGLVAVAAYLRLPYLEYTELGGDQSITLSIAQAWVSRGEFPLVSIRSSFGVLNPPLIEYLYAIPLALWSNILGVAWMTALANVAAVVLPLGVVGRVFGWRVALLSGVLYAANPWSVHYSRLIWNQTLVPPFASLLFAGLLYYFAARPRGIVLAISILALALAIQIHWTSLTLVPVTAAMLILFRQRVERQPLILGTGLAVASFGPYLLYQWRTGFPDVGAWIRGLSLPATTSLASPLVALDLVQAKGVFSTLGSYADAWRGAAGPWEAMDLLAVLLLVAGLGYASARVGREFRSVLRGDPGSPVRVGSLILVLWAVVPVVLFLRYSHFLQNSYFLYMYPVPFILMALPLEDGYLWLRGRLSSKMPGGPHWLDSALAALVFVPALGLAAGTARLDLVGREILVSGGPGDQQIRHVNAAIEIGKGLLAEESQCPLVVSSDGHDAGSSRLGLLAEFLGPGQVRFVAAGQAIVAPIPCAFYLSAVPHPRATGWLGLHTELVPGAAVHTPTDEWRFSELSNEDRTALEVAWNRGQPLAQWEHGLELLGYDVDGEETDSSELQITLVWRVTREPPSNRYHFFVHLVDNQGQIVSQFDGPGVDSLQWRPGDLLWTWFPLTLPSDLPLEGYDLVVGSYEWPSLERVLLSDGRDALTVSRIQESP